MSTIHELVAGARRQLREAGIADDEADLDARLLAERVLHWDAARYFSNGNSLATEAFAERYDAVIARRLRREPVAYITGTQEFWGLTFAVTPAVLIPRPETELIVEVVLEKLPPDAEPRRIADVCTGSGCLAVAIAHERPAFCLTGTDLSPAALEVAGANARRHGISERVSFLAADLLVGIDGPFDAIVSNPPYVPDGDIASLQPEVVQYEPRLALAAGADGLEIVRHLIEQAPSRLVPGGWLIFEFGFGQAEAVVQLVSRSGLELVAIRHDLQDIPRTAVVRRGSGRTTVG